MLDAPLRDLPAWTNWFAHIDVPVLRRSRSRLLALKAREDEGELDLDSRTVAAAVGDDPLMALRIFTHLARRRGARTAAEVTTVERAIVMLGLVPFFRFVGEVTTVEDRLRANPEAHAGLVRVLRRSQRAARFACDIAVWRNDINAEEIVLAALLHDLAEMLLWCFAPALILRIRALQAADPALRGAAVQREVLQVELNELQVALARHWRLPALLVQMMDDHHAETPRVRNVALAASLARHSARSWHNAALPDDFCAIAALLSVTPARARAIVDAPPEEGAGA
jgi:HD-like signal output (HDOD) protein